MSEPTDTIFAGASGQGRAALHVVRISGSRTESLLEAVAGGAPPARRLVRRTLRDPRSGEALDDALVVWMPGPHSFSGEDQAELHLHGGIAVRAACLRVLAAEPGCRPAEPGEFTRRAFLNGRMELSQVEGLADLIDAETEAQRRQALRQLGGELGRRVEAWRAQAIEALALLEAALDFSDEADVPTHLERDAAAIAAKLEEAVAQTVSQARGGERLREGYVVVIAGSPNAGKSTLLNAIARREVAIVSPLPGTTRDAIEVRCDLSGLPVTFVDTAGIRTTPDPIEQAGVSRSRSRAREADLVLWLMAPEGSEAEPERDLASGKVLRIATKSDLGEIGVAADLSISAATGQGLPELLDQIAGLAQTSLGTGDAVMTRERHRRALERAHAALQRLEEAFAREQTELAAEDLRLALRAFGEITGRVDVEEVLDQLFRSFCIGK